MMIALTTQIDAYPCILFEKSVIQCFSDNIQIANKDFRDFFLIIRLNYNKRLQKLLLKNFKDKKRRKYSDETLHFGEYSIKY